MALTTDQWIAAAQVYATMAVAAASAVEEGSTVEFTRIEEFLRRSDVCLDQAGITDAVDDIELEREDRRIELLKKMAADGNESAIRALKREGITDA